MSARRLDELIAEAPLDWRAALATAAAVSRALAFLTTLVEQVREPSWAGKLVLGPIDALSPEHFMGKPLTARSDVFGAGVVLYRLLTGSLPFPVQLSPGTLLAAMLKTQPVAPSARRAGIPPAVDALVLACLAKAAADRPADPATLAGAIRAMLSS